MENFKVVNLNLQVVVVGRMKFPATTCARNIARQSRREKDHG